MDSYSLHSLFLLFWLLSLCIVSLRFAHVVVCVGIVSLSIAEWHCIECICCILFICFPVDGHLDCYQFELL